MKTLTSVFIIVTVTATVLPTIYNTFNPKPLTLKQLSICFSTRDITPIHQCNEEDYKCMVNVVSNLCQ